MNLHRIVKWSTDILNCLRAPNCPARVREKLAWGEGFKTEITEWSQACEMIDRTLKQANETGVSEGASAALRFVLSKLPAYSRWVENMRAELIAIVADNESQLKALGIPELVLPASQHGSPGVCLWEFQGDPADSLPRHHHQPAGNLADAL
jgi:hypothetical protein